MNFHDPDMRVVPTNIEAEQALLGALLLNNAVHGPVSRFLEAGHFHEQFHALIYEKIDAMIRAGKTVDPVTMKGYLPAEIKDLKLDGEKATPMQYLARLATLAVPPALALSYAQAVHDMWIAREALSAAQSAVDTILDIDPAGDVIGQLEPIEERITALRALRIRGETRRGAGQSYLDALSAAYQRGEVRGVPLPIEEIGDVISEPCFEAGNLYGLLSSSGEGKTSLTVQTILYALRKGHPVLFLSYDQSSEQIVRQMVAQAYDIEARRQRNAKLLSEREFEVCVDFANWLDRAPVEIVKCTAQTAPKLVGLARSFIKRRSNGKVPLVVVDHIRVITPESDKGDEGTKALRIGQILKSGAEATDSAWLVLNQRNTFGMRRDNPRPIAADLFGGEGAKAPFDAIFYLYRFMKFLEERRSIASKGADFATIDRVFPSAVRVDGRDLAEIGAIKVRFGDPNIRKTLAFEGRYTRYRSEREQVAQEDLL